MKIALSCTLLHSARSANYFDFGRPLARCGIGANPFRSAYAFAAPLMPLTESIRCQAFGFFFCFNRIVPYVVPFTHSSYSHLLRASVFLSHCRASMFAESSAGYFSLDAVAWFASHQRTTSPIAFSTLRM